MRKVYFGADQIITSLGFTTAENALGIRKGITGIMPHPSAYGVPFHAAYSAIHTPGLEEQFKSVLKIYHRSDLSEVPFTRLEKMLLTVMIPVLEASGIEATDPRMLWIISTTKGNIDLLEQPGHSIENRDSRLRLWALPDLFAKIFHLAHTPMLVSNACISGSAAIIQAARLIASGNFDHALVAGGDIISGFVLGGFQSFQALSPEPCKPFDADRTGLSLGEGAGALFLTADPQKAGAGIPVIYLGGATSNDANHISGPSRDGEGLYLAIDAAMKEAKISAGELDFISAHGTATPYNDEMESLALARAGLEKVPVNSFKGYIGHTLGAAGVIETILSVYSMRNAELFKSIGYQTHGVSRDLNIISENKQQPLKNVLKTASGFGGCNAALVLGR